MSDGFQKYKYSFKGERIKHGWNCRKDNRLFSTKRKKGGKNKFLRYHFKPNLLWFDLIYGAHGRLFLVMTFFCYMMSLCQFFNSLYGSFCIASRNIFDWSSISRFSPRRIWRTQIYTKIYTPFFIPVNYRRLTIYSNLQFMIITGIEMNLDP